MGGSKGQGRALAAVAACLVGLACSTPVSVGSTRDDEADFGAYQSFAMAPRPARPAGLPQDGPGVEGVVRSQLAAGFAARGLRSRAVDDADLVVSFRIGEAEGYSLTGELYGDQLHVAPYIEGHLSVAVYDRARGQMVWHGWASLSVYRSGKREELARRAASQVVARYPQGEATP